MTDDPTAPNAPPAHPNTPHLSTPFVQDLCARLGVGDGEGSYVNHLGRCACELDDGEGEDEGDGLVRRVQVVHLVEDLALGQAALQHPPDPVARTRTLNRRSRGIRVLRGRLLRLLLLGGWGASGGAALGDGGADPLRVEVDLDEAPEEARQRQHPRAVRNTRQTLLLIVALDGGAEGVGEGGVRVEAVASDEEVPHRDVPQRLQQRPHLRATATGVSGGSQGQEGMGEGGRGRAWPSVQVWRQAWASRAKLAAWRPKLAPWKTGRSAAVCSRHGSPSIHSTPARPGKNMPALYRSARTSAWARLRRSSRASSGWQVATICGWPK